MKIGFRPFNSRLSICCRLTSFCTEADSVCNVAALAATSTVSVAAPTVSDASMLRVLLGSSLFPVASNFLNPGASTEIE